MSSLRPFLQSAALIAAALCADSARAQLALRPPSAPVPAKRVPVAPRIAADTGSVHRKLRGAINEFQDLWRKSWQTEESERHAAVNLNAIRGYFVQRDGKHDKDNIWIGDRESANLTTDLRRYLSIICSIGTPLDAEIEAAKFGALAGNGAIIRSRAAIKDMADRRGPQPSKGNPYSAPRVSSASMGFGTASAFSVPGVSWATKRQITSRPNYGSLCPSWQPPEVATPLDEGEAIDLALPPNLRISAVSEREKLIKLLNEAQLADPADTWITGQRVRFAFDQRDPARTVVYAKECKGESAWCWSLQGFALQQADDFTASEAAFRRAESLVAAGAQKDSLCGLGNSLLLLNHDDRDIVKKETCAKQYEIMDRVWWLADPLWSVPGNERYIAHNTRLTHIELRSVTDRDERYVWSKIGGGQTMREMVVRYGWPSYTFSPGYLFEEEINKYRENGREMNLLPAPPYSAMEYSWDRTSLIPHGKALFDPLSIQNDAWELYAPDPKDMDAWWPQEHMFYPTQLAALSEGQDVLLRRDTTIMYQLTIDNPLRNLDTASTAASKAILMGGDSPTTTKLLATGPIAQNYTLRMLTNLSSKPLVMSAEILPRTLREQAMRRRYAVHPPSTLREMKAGEVAISQPVLLRLPNRMMQAPTDEASILRYMAGDLSFIRDEPLALYWESYGFAPGDTIDVELKFRHDEDRNVARRIIGLVGIGSSKDSVSIKWREPDPRHGNVVVSAIKPVVGRTVSVDLSALEGGNYVVSMEMRKGTTITARSERRITVKKRQ